MTLKSTVPALLALLAASAGAQPIENELVNGDFEDGYDGWYYSGNVQVKYYEPWTSFVMWNEYNIQHDGVLGQQFETYPGATYTIGYQAWTCCKCDFLTQRLFVSLFSGGKQQGGYFEDGIHCINHGGRQFVVTNETGDMSGYLEFRDDITLPGNDNRDCMIDEVYVWAHVLITDQPDDTLVSLGGTLNLSVDAYGSEPLDYQWYKNGQKLVDDARVSGSQYRVLTITPVVEEDFGVYTVNVQNPISGETSDLAHVNLGCAADLNGDWEVNVFDYHTFVNLFYAQDPAADCYPDGQFDLSDFHCFINAFLGCK